MDNPNIAEVKVDFQTILDSPNIAKHLPQDFLEYLGNKVLQGYLDDKNTRKQWEDRNVKSMELALQISKEKSFPWTNCSNVKFPLITNAALQFLARVKLLTSGKSIVKMDVVGPDAEGKKRLQADRISQHMNLQLLEEDRGWKRGDEKTKLTCAIIGSAFKKSYFDDIKGRNVSEYVPAYDFVVAYSTKDLCSCRRMTHKIVKDINWIRGNERRGLFLEMDEKLPENATYTDTLRQAKDDSQGVTRSGSYDDSKIAQSVEYNFLEQHCWIDLDGDGFEEPYIVTVREDTAQVLRVVARFTGIGDVKRVNDYAVRRLEKKAKEALSGEETAKLEKEADSLDKADDNHIVNIEPIQHFTQYLFIPSPDDGFYGLGLGTFLGPINHSIDTMVNQLIDAGTMSNTRGGFLGRGVKIKGGKNTFDPFEWKPTESSGGDLKDNIFPLPVSEPSGVLFQLLGLLIEYGERISSSTEAMTGVSPGQNTPAETSRNTIEQGMMLFSDIYGRIYESFTDELRILYDLNKTFLPISERWEDLTSGPNAILDKDDYTNNAFRIFPSADPSMVSRVQQRQKADQLILLSEKTPGFNRYKVVKYWLETYDYDNIDQIYPDPTGPNAVPPPPNPKILELQQKDKFHQDEIQFRILEFKADSELNQAKIIELQARAEQHLAQADGVDMGHQIAMIEAQLGAAKARQEGILKALDTLQKMHTSYISQQGAVNEQETGMGAKSGDSGVPQGAENVQAGNS